MSDFDNYYEDDFEGDDVVCASTTPDENERGGCIDDLYGSVKKKDCDISTPTAGTFLECSKNSDASLDSHSLHYHHPSRARLRLSADHNRLNSKGLLDNVPQVGKDLTTFIMGAGAEPTPRHPPLLDTGATYKQQQKNRLSTDPSISALSMPLYSALEGSERSANEEMLHLNKEKNQARPTCSITSKQNMFQEGSLNGNYHRINANTYNVSHKDKHNGLSAFAAKDKKVSLVNQTDESYSDNPTILEGVDFEARDGVMHKSNVTTVWFLQKEESQSNSFLSLEHDNSVKPICFQKGNSVVADAVRQTSSSSLGSSGEMSPPIPYPADEQEQKRKSDIQDKTSSPSSTLSSVSSPNFNALAGNKARPIDNIFLPKSMPDALSAERIKKIDSKTNESSLNSSLSCRINVRITSPSSQDVDSVGRKDIPLKSKQTVNLYENLHHPLDEVEMTDSHISPTSTEVVLKSNAPSVDEVQRKNLLPLNQKLQPRSQPLPVSPRTSLDSAVGTNCESRDNCDANRQTHLLHPPKQPFTYVDPLSQNLQALKNQISSLNVQIQEKQKEISSLECGQNTAIRPRAEKFDTALPPTKPFAYSKTTYSQGWSSYKKKQRNISSLEKLQTLRLRNKKLEERFKCWDGEITLQKLVDRFTKLLDQGREKLKDAQIVKRGLENCDKRTEHMIEALHRHQPSTEEIKNRQVNENIYNHLNLERKIEQLKDNINLRQNSCNMMLNKCHDLNEELNRRNYAVGVTKSDIEALKTTFQKNKEKIDQLHTAIAIYHNSVNHEKRNSIPHRSASVHMSLSSASTPRLPSNKVTSEEKNLMMRCDSIKQRRQELEDQVRTLKLRIQQRCLQIDTNITHDRKSHSNVKQDPSSHPPGRFSKVNSSPLEPLEQSRRCNTAGNSSDNFHDSKHNSLIASQRLLSDPTSKVFEKGLDSMEGITRKQISGLHFCEGKAEGKGDYAKEHEYALDPSNVKTTSLLSLNSNVKERDHSDKPITNFNNDACYLQPTARRSPTAGVSQSGALGNSSHARLVGMETKRLQKRDASHPYDHDHIVSGEIKFDKDEQMMEGMKSNIRLQPGINVTSNEKKSTKREAEVKKNKVLQEITSSSGRSTPLWLRDR